VTRHPAHCPRCAERDREEAFLVYAERLAAELTEYAQKGRSRALRLIDANFETAEIVEMTGLSEA
jgi:molybdopterin-guanine dinucleotide biosynthesis protein A